MSDDEAAATRGWSSVAGPAPLTLDDSVEDLPPAATNRRRLVLAAWGLGAIALVGITVAATRSPKPEAEPETAAENTPKPAAHTARAPIITPEAFEAWLAPPGPRRDVVVPGYAFSQLSEADLGAVFDAKLRLIHGVPHLFEAHEARRSARNQMSHSFARIKSRVELAVGFAEVAKGSYRNDRFYAAYRALDIREIIAVDEQRRMRKPPETATYYLAEIHSGSSYDALIEGSFRSMGAKLEASLLEGGSIEAGVSGEDYRVSFRGLGLRPKNGTAIFAKEAGDIENAYTTDGAAAPVRLVFRQIPGRKIAADNIPWPQVVHEEQITLDEAILKNEFLKKYDLKAGTYTISIQTRPNGIRVRWSAGGCQTGDFLQLTTICTLSTPATLSIANPKIVGAGDSEVVDVFIARGRDPSAIETSQRAPQQRF